MAATSVLTTGRPIFDAWPALASPCAFASLGDFPTPVDSIRRWLPEAEVAHETYVKRDDLTSGLYGGNKVRTLEALLGQVLRDGQGLVYATGAYGSNHAVATVMHAPRLGLKTGVLLFPQPPSATARENLIVSAAQADVASWLPHWSLLPPGMWRVRWRHGGSRRCYVMPPGGACPRGCLGFVSAALELTQQVREGLLPAPREVIVAVGSTCSTAGLLLGLRLAARRARPSQRPPLLVAVRVTPWPVTSALRVVGLAHRTARWLRALTGDSTFELSRAQLAAGLCIDPSQIGRGYGWPTPEGARAASMLAPLSLDSTYAAKSAAALLARSKRDPRLPRLFWATKSGAPLPQPDESKLGDLPPGARRFLSRTAALGSPAAARRDEVDRSGPPESRGPDRLSRRERALRGQEICGSRLGS